ncbi:MAG: hypothetical protein GY893_05130, partial [bacterium]|nr:hypothetical protein [bacterium]
NFGPVNLLATDQMIDSPTNNFATLNPLIKGTETPVFSEGNLRCVSSGSTRGYFVPATIPVSSGKWYAEFCVTSTDLGFIIGAMPVNLNTGSGYLGGGAGKGSGYYGANGQAYNYDNGGTQDTTPATAANGDIIGVALDLDDSSGKLYIYKNNTILDTVVSGDSFTNYNLKTVNDYWTFAIGNNAAWNIVANFGQDSSFAGNKTAQGNGGAGEDFFYTPPAGYKALNTDNLPDPAIEDPTDHFNSLAFTGTGSTTKNVTGVGFQPDFVWLKTRVNAASHALFDSVRGTNKVINSNTTNVEASDSGAGFSAFDSDGFTVVEQASAAGTINDSAGMISWNWKAGGTASTNTDGAVDTQVSANTTAGFSIVTYTSDGTTTAGHGLSQAPELIIVKRRNSAADWIVGSDYIKLDGPTDEKWHYGLKLNSNVARAEETAWFGYHTAPTATTFPLGNSAQTNVSGGTYVAYCFHSVQGYSKVGSYEGNGNANGSFIYTGFKPAFLLIKRIAGVQDWMLADNKISPYNQTEYMLRPAQSAAQQSGNTIDILSNGFKPRLTGNAFNAGEKYLYMAFAETPFKTTNAR